MAKARTLVGLDVHATKIVAATLDVETGEVRSFRLGGDIGEAAAFCRVREAKVERVAEPVRADENVALPRCDRAARQPPQRSRRFSPFQR